MPTSAAPTMPGAAAVTERLVGLGAVAVIRLDDAEAALRAARAVHAGGVAALEVTLTTPGAFDVIERLASDADDGVLVGAGSVLDAENARRAIDAGARFVVSPVVRPELVDEVHGRGAAALLGAFTPTEILAAHEAGADLVKVFPADALGPAFIKGVLGPMPFLRLVPTGGVTPENAGDWLRAGAAAVGLGGALVDPKLVAAGDFDALTERARRLVASVAAARGRTGGEP
ncbi:MAG TPA: bifunctional 4-hydroxy-2-oxoglutarate aldolase/2-dehydro-3-deoxy-phosphogluconate aldolase [Longimicrobium sp.]|jgi:2-dehydro-3-deoxyphosphogluconate aldolase/(4S)-4-hydroxy-2-oxoglutarate aldolase